MVGGMVMLAAGGTAAKMVSSGVKFTIGSAMLMIGTAVMGFEAGRAWSKDVGKFAEGGSDIGNAVAFALNKSLFGLAIKAITGETVTARMAADTVEEQRAKIAKAGGLDLAKWEQKALMRARGAERGQSFGKGKGRWEAALAAGGPENRLAEATAVMNVMDTTVKFQKISAENVQYMLQYEEAIGGEIEKRITLMYQSISADKKQELKIGISNSENRMAKNVEIGFIFPPDFVTTRGLTPFPSTKTRNSELSPISVQYGTSKLPLPSRFIAIPFELVTSISPGIIL